MVNNGLRFGRRRAERKLLADFARQAARLAVGQRRDQNFCREQNFRLAPHDLLQFDRGRRNFERPGLDGQKIVHPRRFQKFELHPGDHEKQGVATFAGMDRALVKVKLAQHFGAGAFDEAQKIGVIDEAGEIRVLEIDADGEEVC